MITLWRRFVQLMELREVGTSMALVRIAAGACVVRAVLAVVWAGAVPALWYDLDDGGMRDLGHGPWLIELLGGPAAGLVQALVVLSMGGGLLVALGVGGDVMSRVITFSTLQSFENLVDVNGHAGGSYDELTANLLWLLVLAGPSRTLSVECRRSQGRWTSDRPVMAWPRLLVVYQMLLMYSTTGWQKLSVHWVPGGDLSALYYILQQPTWQHHDHAWLAWVFPLTQVGTLVSWAWEVTGPIWGLAFLAVYTGGLGRAGQLLRRWRVVEVYAAIGVTFHLLVALFMDIGPFTWISLSLYPALWGPEVWARWGRVTPASGAP